jgi:preprotein translocase subunit YajC
MSGSSSGIAQFIPLILIFVIFYFFLIRPQQKKIKDHKLMVSVIKRGDEVVTSGGMYGKVDKVYDDDKVDLSISENVTVKVVKSTIQSVLSNPSAKK